MVKSKIKVSGSKKKGWIVEISDNCGYKEDFALTHEEVVKLRDLLVKKVK